MITYSEYEAYFEGLATSLVDIAHTEQKPQFAIMDIDDILGSQRGKIDFTSPVMILENPEGRLAYKHDQLQDENLGAFHILQDAGRDNPTRKRQVMDLTKTIGTKVISRMQYDKIQKSTGTAGIPQMLLYFDLAQVRYLKIGPIFSGCYGWRFEFNLAEQTPIIYDADDWT